MINQICFERRTSKNGSAEKVYIGNGFRWTRELTKFVKKKYINTTIAHQKSIVKVFREYKHLAQTISAIGKSVVNYQCKNNLVNPVVLEESKICHHLPNKIHPTALSRSHALLEIRKLLENTSLEFNFLENIIDNKVKFFNFKNHFRYGGLAFSWRLIQRNSPILSIAELTQLRIKCPINEYGKRSRYKEKIKKLTRDYLRKIKMERNHKLILADSRVINLLAKKYLVLRQDTHARHKLLKDFSLSVNGVYIPPIDC